MKTVSEAIYLVQRLTAINPTSKYSFAIVCRTEDAGIALYDAASCQLLAGQAGLIWTDQLAPYHQYLYSNGSSAGFVPHDRKLAFVLGTPADIEALKKDYPVTLHCFYRDMKEAATQLGVLVDDLFITYDAQA